MTFRDLIGKTTTVYSVSHGGCLRRWDNVKVTQFKILNVNTGVEKTCTDLRNGPLMNIDDLDSNKAGLTKNGNISIGWSHAVFLDVNEAAELAEKIVTAKYNNSMAAINRIKGED